VAVVALLALLVLLPAAPLRASVVVQTSLSEMLAGCELVFEGVVTKRWAERDAKTGGIYTWVRFRVLGVVEGSFAQPRLDLRFMGGEIGGIREEISGLQLPAVGERGIYFVESLQRFQVNPLFGWDQGRLRIVRDATGHPRVVSADGRPVMGLGRAARAPHTALTSGVADGILVDRSAALAQAVDPSALEAQLRALLGASR